MKRVVLYIAMSLDGYIADGKGGVDWLKGQNEAEKLEDTFTPFFNDVDTVIMGRKTFDQIVRELSPKQWPYNGATTYVLSHQKETNEAKNICFKNMDICQLVEELRQEAGKDIWICGGAEIARPLIAKDMIDTYHLAIIPVILGGGVRLFDGSTPKIDLTLVKAKKYNGIVEVVYSQRQHIIDGKSVYNIADRDVVIRRMSESDTDQVMQIWLATNIQAHDFVPESYWRNQFDDVKKIIPSSEVYICEKSTEIVGFIGLAESYIAGIFVTSEFQSYGIGKRLLDYAKALKPELYLHVYQKNIRAIRFYQREGFVIEAENTDENTGETEFLMRTL